MAIVNNTAMDIGLEVNLLDSDFIYLRYIARNGTVG